MIWQAIHRTIRRFTGEYWRPAPQSYHLDQPPPYNPGRLIAHRYHERCPKTGRYEHNDHLHLPDHWDLAGAKGRCWGCGQLVN